MPRGGPPRPVIGAAAVLRMDALPRAVQEPAKAVYRPVSPELVRLCGNCMVAAIYVYIYIGIVVILIVRI